MVQITLDTNNDPLEELEQALHVLENAIQRRKGAAPQTEETAIDTPFLKISIKSDDTEPAAPQVPTLNQLIHDESLTEEELTKMFKQVQDADPPAKKPEKKQAQDQGFIEIVELDEREEKEE